jgi:hypothetical protein
MKPEVRPVMSELPRLLPLVVGTKEAARILNCGEEKIAEFVAGGYLTPHPHLSFAKKRAFAVRELERFAAVGMERSETGNLRVVP